MLFQMLVGKGCSEEQIINAFRDLKVSKKAKEFNAYQLDFNRDSILAFMRRKNYHEAFMITADNQQAIFPMEEIAKEKDIFYTKGKILFRFRERWLSWEEWIEILV